MPQHPSAVVATAAGTWSDEDALMQTCQTPRYSHTTSTRAMDIPRIVAGLHGNSVTTTATLHSSSGSKAGSSSSSCDISHSQQTQQQQLSDARPTCIIISPSIGSLNNCAEPATTTRPRRKSSTTSGSRVYLQIPGAQESDMEDLLYELDGKLTRLRQIQQELQNFQMTCRDARAMVQATAKELVSRIIDHQNRLFDELDTRQDTELRKLGFSADTLEDYIDKMSKLQEQGYAALQRDDTDTLTSIQQKMENPQLFWSDSINKLLCENEDTEKEDEELLLPKLTFTAIRCNTAFGSIEDGVSETASQVASVSHDRSSSIMSNLSIPSSPVLSRNRAQSARESPQHKMSFLQLQKSLSLDMNSPQTFRRSKSVRERGTARNSTVLLERIHNSLKRSNSMRESRVQQGGASFVPLTLWEVTEQGNKPGQLGSPCSISFLPSNDIVISEKDNERLQIFSEKGKFVRVIGQGRLKPIRLCVTKQGNIAVTDAKDSVVKIYDINGQCKGSFGKRRFKSLFKIPYAIAENQRGEFIVSDMEKHTVGIYSVESGKCVRVLEPGRGSQFKSPFYITTDNSGRIIVSDNEGAQIQVFDSHGNYILTFDRYSDTSSEHDMLKFPNGVGVDDRNNILVADWGNHSVSMFSPSGHFIKHVVTRSQSLTHPADIAVRVADCQLLVSEYSEDHSALRLYKVAL